MSVGSNLLAEIAINEKTNWKSEGWADGLTCFLRGEVLDESNDY